MTVPSRTSLRIETRTLLISVTQLARKTIENFVQRALRLYEQELGGRFSSPQLESYVAHWRRWTTAGLEGCPPPAWDGVNPRFRLQPLLQRLLSGVTLSLSEQPRLRPELTLPNGVRARREAA